MRFAAGALLVCFILAGCGGAKKPSGPAAGASGPLVLGAKDFVGRSRIGFGTAHPANLVVGGDPSVTIMRIRWHGWGRRRASGVGRYAAVHYGHGGSYYSKRARADLRVSGIGRCQPNGPRTYMALKVRVALQPGQRPRWYEVDGSHALCSYP
ncbi:MAG: hypothetical protein JWM71_277 [Solirubrobacteraceae bacterium]|nr:hypothetical protein [Solirubrobacteraceae bacterium]